MNLPAYRKWTDSELDELVRSYFQSEANANVFGRRTHYADDVVRVDEVDVVLEDGTRRAQWLVYGDVPFLDFGSSEVPSAVDALGLYTWFTRLWLRAIRGLATGDLPQMLESGTWQPMDPTPTYVSWLNPRVTYLQYKLMPSLGSQILHPEIRERLKRIHVRFDDQLYRND